MSPEEICPHVTPGDLMQYCQPLTFIEQWGILVRYLTVVGFPWVSLVLSFAVGWIVAYFFHRKVQNRRAQFIANFVIAALAVLVPIAWSYLAAVVCLPLCTEIAAK